MTTFQGWHKGNLPQALGHRLLLERGVSSKDLGYKALGSDLGCIADGGSCWGEARALPVGVGATELWREGEEASE